MTILPPCLGFAMLLFTLLYTRMRSREAFLFILTHTRLHSLAAQRQLLAGRCQMYLFVGPCAVSTPKATTVYCTHNVVVLLLKWEHIKLIWIRSFFSCLAVGKPNQNWTLFEDHTLFVSFFRYENV